MPTLTPKENLIKDLDDVNNNYTSIETMPCDFTDLPDGTDSVVAILLFQPEKRWAVFCYDDQEELIQPVFRNLG